MYSQDHARAQRSLAAAALAVKRIRVIVGVLPEVTVKEILEWILALALSAVWPSGTAAWLGIRFSADVHHRGLYLFGHLPKSAAELLRRRN